jgi:hypothetical protein
MRSRASSSSSIIRTRGRRGLCNILWASRHPEVDFYGAKDCEPCEFKIHFDIEDILATAAPGKKAVVRFTYRTQDQTRGLLPPTLDAFNIIEDAEDIRYFLGRESAAYPPLVIGADWLENCNDGHEHCSTLKDVELPTRLIDVGQGQDDPKLTLCKTGQKGRYLALSHCWGIRKFPLLTTRSNVEDLCQRIPLESLVKNFQDAISVTRHYGYRYLWVGSLCIIQDDQADWERECPRMHAVYSNAAFTIAAVGAPDGNSGFLGPRNALPDRACEVEFTPKSRSKVCKIRIGWMFDVAFARSCSEDLLARQLPAVLDNRAWALQERLLSPRILSFGTHQMYFECNSAEYYERCRFALAPPTWKSETRAYQAMFRSIRRPWLATPMESNFRPRDDFERLARDFYDVVEQYTECQLTDVKDKLPALSGIARRYQKLTGDQYFGGLWKHSIAHGLAWNPDGRCIVPAEPPVDGQIPSWSLASTSRGVHFYEGYVSHVEVVQERKHQPGGDVLIQATSDELWLNERPRFAYMRPRKKDIFDARFLETKDADEYDAALAIGWLNPDKATFKANQNLPREVTCLPLSSGPNRYKSPSSSRVALVLERDPERANRFRRVGISMQVNHGAEHLFMPLSESLEWMLQGEEQMICLV